MKIVNSRQKNDHNTLKLTKPEMRWEMDAFLALHEANSMIATGRKEVRPIEDVANANFEWENSVYTELDHLRWLEDYYNGLSPEMRALVEKPTLE